jgi:hypothetical protein
MVKSPLPVKSCKLLAYAFKVPLKTKIVQILFSQIHQNYAKYAFETFTVDRITIAYQIESMA